MNTVQTYEIGKICPGISPNEDISGGRIIFTPDSFNVILGISEPTTYEIASLYDEVSYGVYINGIIPFFCIATQEFSTAFSMNFLKVKGIFQIDWLIANTKQVGVFMVDSESHILKAFRYLHLPWMPMLKEVLGNQRLFEKSVIDEMIKGLESTMSVKAMVYLCSLRHRAAALDENY